MERQSRKNADGIPLASMCIHRGRHTCTRRYTHAYTVHKCTPTAERRNKQKAVVVSVDELRGLQWHTVGWVGEGWEAPPGHRGTDVLTGKIWEDEKHQTYRQMRGNCIKWRAHEGQPFLLVQGCKQSLLTIACWWFLAGLLQGVGRQARHCSCVFVPNSGLWSNVCGLIADKKSGRVWLPSKITSNSY